MNRPLPFLWLAPLFVVCCFFVAGPAWAGLPPNPAEAANSTRFVPIPPPTEAPLRRLKVACDDLVRVHGDLAKSADVWDEDSETLRPTRFDTSCADVQAALDYCRDPLNSAAMDADAVFGASLELESAKEQFLADPSGSFSCRNEKGLVAAATQYYAEEGPTVTGAGALVVGAGFQEKLIDALSSFLIKRARAEALQWFGERVTIGICRGPESPEVFFPNVCAALGANNHGPAQRRTVSWGMVRQAGSRDLQQLPAILVAEVFGRIHKRCADPKHAAKSFCRQDALRLTNSSILAFTAISKATKNILEGATAFETIAELHPFVEQVRTTMGEAEPVVLAEWLETLGWVAELSRVTIGAQVGKAEWRPSREELEHLVGLLATKMPSSKVPSFFRCSEETEETEETEVAACVDRRLEMLSLLLRRLNRFATAIQLAQGEPGDEARVEVVDALADLFSVLADLAREQHTPGADRQTGMSCGGGSTDAAACAVVLLEGSEFAVRMVDAIKEREYTAAVEHFMIWFGRQGNATQLPNWAQEYLPFLAELATAKDAASMEGVLESVAAPVGSYKVKRGNPYNGISRANRKPMRKSGLRNTYFGLNAYVGVQVGGEDLLGGTTGGHFGPTASVGLEVGGGVGKSSSMGLYVSLIDVGMLGDFRFGTRNETVDGEEVESTATVGFAQVFAPGAFWMIGLGNSPLALGFGAQFAPALRRTTPSSTLEEGRKLSAARFGAILAIDIPLWITH